MVPCLGLIFVISIKIFELYVAIALPWTLLSLGYNGAALIASQWIWFEGHEPQTGNKPFCLNYGQLYSMLSLFMLQILNFNYQNI